MRRTSMVLHSKKPFIFILIAALLFTVFVPFTGVIATGEGQGNLTVAEALALGSGNATVQGYIVGTTNTTSILGSGVFEGPFTVRTNLLIADDPNERDLSKIMPIQLPNDSIRTATNLVDSPENLGKEISFTGNIALYFSVTGLRDVKAYAFITEEPIDEDPIDDPVRDYLTVREAIDNNSGTETVEGFIVGTRSGTTSGSFVGPFTSATNIMIADHPDERALVNTLPVQLPSGAIRTALNLVDHPENLGMKVRITGDLAAYFSSPGLRNSSAFELITDGDIPDIVIPNVTISEARHKMGQVIITEGIVNVDNGLLQPGRLSVYIQDENAGIQLFNYSPIALNEGDRVKVKGQVGEFNRVTQIFVEELEVLESGLEVSAKNVTIADYQTSSIAESYEGQLVKLEGYIYSVPEYSSGGTNMTLIDEDLNVVVIRAWESTGLDLSSITPNKWYEITAISSQYSTTYQLLPRSNEDLNILENQKDKPFSNGKEVRATVERVVDGDTVRLATSVFGANNVRFLNIDTLETYHTVKNELDQIQMDLGKLAGEHLKTIISDGDEVILRIGEEPLDSYGRLLAEVITLDGVNTNYEMVKAGHAVTYFIWPFEDDVVRLYAEASKEARENQIGIWKNLNWEYPFEFRARERGDEPVRPVGDYRTKLYVPAAEWKTVLPEYRVFFNTEEDAITAGYSEKPISIYQVIEHLRGAIISLHESEEINKRSTFNVLMNQLDTIGMHEQKVKEFGDSPSRPAHQKNLSQAIEKLERDLEREFINGNLSIQAFEQISAYIEMLTDQTLDYSLAPAS